VRYEVAVCIKTGDIVWINGPFPCSDWPDIKIFRQALQYELAENERVEADDGYLGDDPRLIKVPKGQQYLESERVSDARQLARGRHETVNHLLKQFKVVHKVFHHDVEKHEHCFRACTVLMQLSLDLDCKHVFQVAEEYTDTGPNADTMPDGHDHED
jgi:hypothetical protein